MLRMRGVSNDRSLTIDAAPAVPVAKGTAQISQNITLSGVQLAKFKLAYVISALSTTLMVDPTSIYAKITGISSCRLRQFACHVRQSC